MSLGARSLSLNLRRMIILLSKRDILLSSILIFLISVVVGCDSNISAGYIIKVRSLQADFTGGVAAEKSEITCVRIDWGDDRGETIVRDDFHAMEASHIYREEGAYTVTITITDNRRRSYRTTQDITVAQSVNHQKEYKNSGVGFFVP